MPTRNTHTTNKKASAPKTLAKDGFEWNMRKTREERAKKISKALDKRGFVVDEGRSTTKKPIPIKKPSHHHASPSSAAGMPVVASGSAGLQLVNGHNIVQGAGGGGGGSLGGTLTPGTPGSSWGQGGGGGNLTVPSGSTINMNHNEIINGRGLARSHTSTTTYQSPPGWS